MFEKGGKNLCDNEKGIGVAILDPVTKITKEKKFDTVISGEV